MKLLTVLGARPQFIKAAPVSRAIKTDGRMGEVMVHTGQHFDAAMSQVFFDELGLDAPSHNLEIHGGGHGEMTGRMLMALEPLMEAETPDGVLIYGDTNSTLAGALVAAKLHIPVFHVEAGLRSFRMSQPEEINRRMADHVSTLLFCPTTVAVGHLADEGITNGVINVGDVMYDAALLAAASDAGSDIITRLDLTPGSYRVATAHRAENTDARNDLVDLLDYLKAAAKEGPVVMPLHPRTKAAAEKYELNFDGITLIEPVGYLEMTHLVKNSAGVLTDSGGLQKEAYFHSVPCVTLRDETEWVETVAAGWNRLWKTPDYTPRTDINEYGDGHAAEKTAAAIAGHLEAND